MLRRCVAAPLRRLSRPVSRRMCTETARRVPRRGGGVGSTIIPVALGGVFGWAGFGLAWLYLEWPEGCQVLVSHLEQSGIMRDLFGSPIKVNRLKWDGSYNQDRVRVNIVVEGPQAKGTLYGGAVRIDDQWLVLACELRVEEVDATFGAQPATHLLTDEDEEHFVKAIVDEKTKETDPESKSSEFAEDHTVHVRDLVGKTFDVIGNRWLNAEFGIVADSSGKET